MSQDSWLDDAAGEILEDAVRTGRDLALAGASQIPVIGILKQAWEARMQRDFRERVDTALEWLERKIDDAKEDVNQEFLKTKEFGELLEITLREIADARDEEHRDYFKSFLFGAARQEVPNVHKARRLLRLLEDLNPIQIRLLYVLREREGNVSILEHVMERLVDLTRGEALMQLQELRRLGLYNSQAEMEGALLVPEINEAGERVWDNRELTPRARELLDFLGDP